MYHLNIHLMNGETLKFKAGTFTFDNSDEKVIYICTNDERRFQIPKDKICYTEEYKNWED